MGKQYFPFILDFNWGVLHVSGCSLVPDSCPKARVSLLPTPKCHNSLTHP